MKNIFVVGLDDFHRAQLETLPGAAQYAFHRLFTYNEIKQQERFPVARLLEQGADILRSFPRHVDAVIGYWDFPVSTALPILRRPLGLPGPSLEAVLMCEHKYWSRTVQAQVAAEHVPAFCALDPFAEDPLQDVSVGFPFWLKPVKSVLSRAICAAAFFRNPSSVVDGRAGRRSGFSTPSRTHGGAATYLNKTHSQ